MQSYIYIKSNWNMAPVWPATNGTCAHAGEAADSGLVLIWDWKLDHTQTRSSNGTCSYNELGSNTIDLIKSVQLTLTWCNWHLSTDSRQNNFKHLMSLVEESIRHFMIWHPAPYLPLQPHTISNLWQYNIDIYLLKINTYHYTHKFMFELSHC